MTKLQEEVSTALFDNFFTKFAELIEGDSTGAHDLWGKHFEKVRLAFQKKGVDILSPSQKTA